MPIDYKKDNIIHVVDKATTVEFRGKRGRTMIWRANNAIVESLSGFFSEGDVVTVEIKDGD